MNLYVGLFLTLLGSGDSFTAPSPKATVRAANMVVPLYMASDRQPEEAPSQSDLKALFNPLPSVAAMLCAFSSTAANAAGPDWGTTFYLRFG